MTHRDPNPWFPRVVAGAAWNDIEKFFRDLVGEEQLPPRIAINHDVIEIVLRRPDNAELRALVYVMFERAYKLGSRGQAALEKAREQHGINRRRGAQPLEIAVHLMVNHPDAFELAWALHSAWGHRGMVSEYSWPLPDLRAIKRGLRPFERQVKEWFRGRGQGSDCKVKLYETGDDILVWCARSDHLQILVHWVDRQIKVDTVAPVGEDALLFHRRRESLSVRAPTPTVRGFYVSACRSWLGDDRGIFGSQTEAPAYTLAPINEGTYMSGGDGVVKSACVTRLVLENASNRGGKVEMASDDALEDLRQERLRGTFVSACPVEADICFVIRSDRPEMQRIIRVRPPHDSSVHTSSHCDEICNCLKWQRIRLI